MATNHMSTEQAKHQGLSGSDVFRFSHLRYHDPLNRDAGVVHLNVEAYKSFSDTVLLTQRDALAGEQRAAKEWLAAGGFASNTPLSVGRCNAAYIDYVNYEPQNRFWLRASLEGATALKRLRGP